MPDPGKATVVGEHGLKGTLLDKPSAHPSRDETASVRLDDGRVVTVPAEALVLGSDGTWLMPFGPDDFDRQQRRADAADQDEVIPVIAEELVVDKKAVPTGGVRVTRNVLEHEETVELPLMKEHVDVRRVVIDRAVDGPLPIRREGDTTVIPIVEEEVVVMKRYRLKEEVHVTRLVREELHREQVTVRRQEPVIERMDSDGRAQAPAPPERPVQRPPERESVATRPRRPRKSILGE